MAEPQRRAAPRSAQAEPFCCPGAPDAGTADSPPPNSVRKAAETLGARGRARLQPTNRPTKRISDGARRHEADHAATLANQQRLAGPIARLVLPANAVSGLGPMW